MKRHTIIILNRQEIGERQAPKEPFCVISITGSPSDNVDLRRLRGATGVLRLAFNEDHFTRQMARSVWEFVRDQDGNAETYLIHCGAGRIRSASIASGIALFRGGGVAEVKRIFAERDPRPEIYDQRCETYPEIFPVESVESAPSR